MAVGDPRKVRYSINPRSEKLGVHMQPRGAGVSAGVSAGVRFKMLSRGR